MGKKTHGQRSRPKHWPRQVGGGLRSYDGEVREERKYPPGCLGKEPERHRGTRGIGRTRLKAEDSTSLMSGDVITSVLSHHNKDLKQRTLKSLVRHSSRTVHVMVLGQISFI